MSRSFSSILKVQALAFYQLPIIIGVYSGCHGDENAWGCLLSNETCHRQTVAKIMSNSQSGEMDFNKKSVKNLSGDSHVTEEEFQNFMHRVHQVGKLKDYRRKKNV